MTLIYAKRSASTYDALKFSFLLGRYFGMCPIEGLTSSNMKTLKFRLISISTIYTVGYMVGILTVIYFHFYHCISTLTFRFGHFVSIVFFTCAFVSTGLFLRLCTKLPNLMHTWMKVDNQLRGADFSKNLTFKLRVITVVVLVGALLEHILFLSSAISNIPHEGWTRFQIFLKTNFSYAFDHVSFAVWKGVLLMMLSFMCTFTWNDTDLFIILLSTALTSKLNCMNYRMRMVLTDKSKDMTLWNKLRHDFNSVSDLCKLLDHEISDIVFLSFGINLFIILVQLYNSLKPRSQSVVGQVYFMYSFMFLIFRAVGVLLYGSSIHEANKETGIILMSTPSDVYNPAIERLLYKINFDPLALTGKRFFYVTRPLILNIASAIVTYELVLLQFHMVQY